MDALETLKNSFIFKTLEKDELDVVKDILREHRFQEGDVIMQEGEEGDTMYMVVEGELDVSKSLTMKFGDNDFRKTDKVLTRFSPDDHVVFGEMALIGREKRSATIIARTACVSFEINRDEFMGLIEDQPKIGVKVLFKLSELLVNRLRVVNQDVIKLTTALSIALSK